MTHINIYEYEGMTLLHCFNVLWPYNISFPGNISLRKVGSLGITLYNAPI